jgi:predicted dehydrogenase
MTTRIGLIGAGSMGVLHARVAASHPRCTLAWVSDPAADRGRQVAARYASTWVDEPRFDDVDAVIVAAPTQFHDALARAVIDAGLPLLLEKPLADSFDDASALVDLARSTNTVLMCGLLERFNPAVRTAGEIAREPIHVSTVRHSPYADRIRTGVAGDLLIHDVDMVLRLIGTEPTVVTGRCGQFDPRSDAGSEDVAEATMLFPGGQVATSSASRVSQRKVRTLTIAELDRLVEVDLLRQDITVYRHVQASEFDEDAGYRQQTIIEIPVVRHLGEPLQLQLDHFLSLIDGTSDPNAELDGVLAPHAVVAAIAQLDGRHLPEAIEPGRS